MAESISSDIEQLASESVEGLTALNAEVDLEFRPKSRLKRITLATAMVATTVAAPVVADGKVGFDTRWTPFFVESSCSSDDFDSAQIAAAEIWAKGKDEYTSSEISAKANSVPESETAQIRDQRELNDFEVVGSLQLPNYDVNVRVASDDPEMVDKINPEALEQILLWPYQNPETVDVPAGVRDQAINAIECDHQAIKDGGVTYSMLIPSEYDNSCIRGRTFVTPAVACGPDGRYIKWSFDSFRLFGTPHISMISSGDRNGDGNQELAEILTHEWAHAVDGERRGILGSNPDAKEREAYAYLIERMLSDNFDFDDFELFDNK